MAAPPRKGRVAVMPKTDISSVFRPVPLAWRSRSLTQLFDIVNKHPAGYAVPAAADPPRIRIGHAVIRAAAHENRRITGEKQENNRRRNRLVACFFHA